jgi:hypothetical protein
MKNLYKRVLIVFFIGVLLFPIIQLSFDIIELKPLRGAITKVEKKDFSFKGWFSAEYQDNIEKYITDNIGFRSFLIRLFNQIQFSFFKNASAKSVVVGKDNYLYELDYINAYNGRKFSGSPLVKSKINKIKTLQDTLEKLNKSLIICLSPGKGTFFPEYFPSQFKANHTDSTNHKLYIKHLEKENVNYIDANSWFRSIKDTSKYVLYPKYGIHWSYYGGLLFADSLISYIEKLRNVKMNHIKMHDFELVEEYRYSDYDIGSGMNLLTELTPEKMCYPAIEWDTDSANDKPKAIVISDSFYWGLYRHGFNENVFTDGEFWYYNKEIHSQKGTQPVKDIDIRKKIDEVDIIIIMSTEVNYQNAGWGFVSEALKLYFEPSHEIHDFVKVNSEIRSIMNRIKANKKWFEAVKEKAKKRGLDVDEMLVRDAYWLYEKRLRKRIEATL